MRKNLCKSIAAALAAAVAFTSMPGSVQAAKIKISVSSCVLSKGDKIDLNIIGKKEASGKYATSQKKVATVSKKGMVIAKKKGKATITWTKGNKKYACKVKVVKAPELSTGNVAVTEGENQKVSVSKYGNTSLKVTWTSANNSIAAVKKGVITGNSEGTTTVTAKIKGNYKTYKKNVKVTVTKKQEINPGENQGENQGQQETEDIKTIIDAGSPEDSNSQEVQKPSQNNTTTSGSTNSGSTGSGSGSGSGNQGGTGTDKPEEDLYKGYQLKWEDSFDGDSLNLDDWNIELHDPGWVNSELQEYTDSSENIYIEDGNLVLKPVETVDENGKAYYTSGRVNTQNKHNFKYGLFEARVKVPEGQGFLPAFWMMPANENLYGQWPRCGEIDIMEVLGNKTDTSYGTIHYGNPHSESQGKYTLEKGSFSNEYHTFQAEWEPGKINWYVDGKLIHSEDDWYSITEGQGEITYPAPFDQPFYLILNLAVGGNWPGNPDETTNIKDAAYKIDYVRVYQKDSYNEDVKKPEKQVILRDPDKNGNYVNNGDFSSAEDLTDEKDWGFLTALEGEASAEIKDHEIFISTVNEGTVDYSVQLVQPEIPMKRGGVYTVSFDARASEERKMKVDVSAPDRGYKRYFPDTTVDLTTEKKTYTYEFIMTDKDDANGRLEFNLGSAGSKADVWIGNVSIVKTREEDLDANTEKTVLADGNYVYNGSFQEGEKRLGYWDIKDAGAQISVTNQDNIRKLKIVAPEGISKENPVVVSQDGLALLDGDYAMSFLAEGENGKSIQVMAAGQEFTAELTGEEKTYNYKLSIPGNSIEPGKKSIAFHISQPGTYYIDNVRLVEDSLIKNGSFNAGFSGYEIYADASASVSYVVDSLTEENAADFTVLDTGDQAWKIQLKQNNIELEKGQWYRLSLEAKSDKDRKLMFAIQRDGTSDDDWTPYSGEKIVDLGREYETYTIEFQMSRETDLKSVLSISMGAVAGEQISEKHRICIDNINLEKIEEPEVPEQPAGENMLKNGDFSDGKTGWETTIANWEGCTADAVESFADKKAEFAIASVGTEDWHVQLKQSGITLEKGSAYKITFKAVSTETRTIKLAMLNVGYDWYGGADIVLEKDQEKEIEVDIPVLVDKETDTNISMVVSMGQIENIETPASTITLSDFSLVKVEQ